MACVSWPRGLDIQHLYQLLYDINKDESSKRMFTVMLATLISDGDRSLLPMSLLILRCFQRFYLLCIIREDKPVTSDFFHPPPFKRQNSQSSRSICAEQPLLEVVMVLQAEGGNVLITHWFIDLVLKLRLGTRPLCVDYGKFTKCLLLLTRVFFS